MPEHEYQVNNIFPLVEIKFCAIYGKFLSEFFVRALPRQAWIFYEDHSVHNFPFS